MRVPYAGERTGSDPCPVLSSHRKLRDHLEAFLQELLLPNLEWQAGRTAAAVRTAALSCLYALLQGGGIAAQQV